jgi:hypothetical protein
MARYLYRNKLDRQIKKFQMDTHHDNQNGQINPGDMDRFGNEAVIKRNEGISEQANQWSDEEPINAETSGVLGEKAEKYIRESGEIEDLPDEEDEQEAEKVMQDDDDGENEDDVIEPKEDYVPGYDLGRNKVQ